ncbi:MAG: dual specificity protein phosphatase family protein [Acidobacteria bacterium]|nr:dual specificity protein phosphatase family protein [Acidobacteriota bacterium]
MKTKIYWIAEIEKGKIGIMARPRGEDWLEEEIENLKQENVNILISLLTKEETLELMLREEESICKNKQIEFISYPINDREVPLSLNNTKDLIVYLLNRLDIGKNIVVHCRQGIGRASLLTACILGVKEPNIEKIFDTISTFRTCKVPDTPEQILWVKSFASFFRNNFL